MKKIKEIWPQLVVIGVALIAFILGIFLAGIKMEEDIYTATITLLGMMFGGSKCVQKAGGMEEAIDLSGGMSIFGLISFILLVLGIIALVVSMFKDDKFALIGYVLIILAGICIFLLKVAGTDVSMVIGDYEVPADKFTDAFEEFKLGAGAIVYGILAILGGAFGLVKKYIIK